MDSVSGVRVKMSRNVLRFFSVLWKLSCLLALAACLYYRSTSYFAYLTTGKTAFFTPVRIWFPRVSLCFSLKSLLLGQTEYFFEGEDKEAIFLNRSVSELFRITPKINETLDSCAFRNFDLNAMMSANTSEECTRMFNITKYRMQGYMCYMYQVNTELDTYNLFGISYALKEARVIFSLALSKPLSDGHKMCPLIHFSNKPLEDRNFNQELIPPRNKPRTFQLSYDLLILNQLPAPYVTNCINNISMLECLIDCWDSVYLKYGVARPSGISLASEDELIVPDYVDTYKGKSVNEISHEADEECKDRCKHEACMSFLTTTIVSSAFTSMNNERLVFVIKNVGHPPFMMKHIPFMTMMDYLTEMASLGGIWVSFSVFDLSLLIFSGKQDKMSLSKLKQIKSQARMVGLKFRIMNLNSIVFQGKTSNDEGLVQVKRVTSKLYFFIYILVFGGFVFQIHKVCQLYFSYLTIIRLSYNFNPVIRSFPHLVLCFDLYQLLDTTEYPTATEANYVKTYSQRSQVLNSTLKELMTRTPRPESLLESCRIRRWQGNSIPMLRKLSTDECKSQFTVSRFYWDRDACYQFTYNGNFTKNDTVDELRQHELKVFITHPGLLYTAIINPSLVRFHKVKSVLHEGNITLNPPDFSVELYPRKETEFLALLSCHVLDVKLLPPPFDTNCRSSNTTAALCRRKCLMDLGKKFNRLPNDQIYSEFEDLNYKVISFTDLKDETFYSNWQDIENECTDKCSHEDCSARSCIVYLNLIERSKEKLEFAIDAFHHPVWYLDTKASMSHYDFYYNCFCCLSFWFGFAFIELDPALYWLKRRQRRPILLLTQKVNQIKKLVLFINQSVNHVYSQLKISGSEKARKSSWAALRKRILSTKVIFSLVLFVPCIWHLQQTISNYMNYPTVMILKAEIESPSSRFELSICLNLHEIFFQKKNFSSDLDWHTVSVLQGITLREIFAETPNQEDILTACGFRGLNATGPEGKVSDRIFFTESNYAACKKRFSTKKYLLKSYACYQFGEHDATSSNGTYNDLPYPHPINSQDSLMMVALNLSILTKEIMLSVAIADQYPTTSSIWSPTVILKESPRWYAVSYSKYVQETLPYYYSQDGFDDILYGQCYLKCYNGLLNLYGFVYPGVFDKPSDFKYLTVDDRKQPETLKKFRKIREKCRKKCESTDEFAGSSRYAYTATSVTGTGNQSFFQHKNSHTFFLHKTEYPVLIVIFRAAQTFFSLVIVLGSILGIWYGLYMSYLCLLLKNSPEEAVSVGQLTSLAENLQTLAYQLNHLQDVFTKNRRRSRQRLCRKCRMPLI